MKIWADKYAFPVEIKCSGDLIRPKIIVVTSNYTIETVFPDPSIHKPLLRRFKVIHKEHAWDADVNTVMMPKQPQAVGVGLFENKKPKIAKKPALKKRKFDEPAKAKKPWISKKGEIVPNTTTQMVIEDTLNKTVEITPFGLPTAEDLAKEKEVIELIDSTEEECDMDILENLGCDNCNECGQNIAICDCYDDDEFHYDGSNIQNEFGNESFDECSEDLFDI